ncbi:MAG: phosphoribosylformylglycinamidine cyclo-ligase [Clostridiales bacterium]
MEKSYSKSYKEAGVDITAGYQAVKMMQQHIARTVTPGVLSGIGGFGGLFQPALGGIKEPVLVSGTDGVGTKLKLAFILDKHDTVGIDCVAMSVNDVICTGAAPLFFLDYIACGKNIPDKIAAIVSGIATACVQAGAALIGGETAEMPGFYPEDEYDLAGFAVGLVDKSKIIDNHCSKAGDVLIALPSSGLHSNGFSLVRQVFPMDRQQLHVYQPELGQELGQALLTPTRIYVKSVLAVLDKIKITGISHITGGGFYENIPRSLPTGLTARIDQSKLQTPPLFALLQKNGHISSHDMFNTFNMGVGMCLTAAEADADAAIAILKAHGEQAYVIGDLIVGEDGVQLC